MQVEHERQKLFISSSTDDLAETPQGDLHDAKAVDNFFKANPLAFQNKLINFEFLWNKILEDEPIEAGLIAVALNSLYSVQYDPHTYITPKLYYYDNLIQPVREVTAFGFRFARVNGKLFIQSVGTNSPADAASLRPGDEILEIKEVPSIQIPVSMLRILTHIKNEITLKIKRDDKVFDVDLYKFKYAISVVNSQLLSIVKPVGVIKISKFLRGACHLFNRELDKLEAHNVRGLIIDLRGNSGGLVDEANCIASRFLPKDEVTFFLEHNDGTNKREYFYSETSRNFKGSLAILIDSGSASASELLAGSLREHRRAVLVGNRTFGKGSYQEIEPWQNKVNVILFRTKGFFHLPSGYSPQLLGITPDIEMKSQSYFLTEAKMYISPLKTLKNNLWKKSTYKERDCLLPEYNLENADPIFAKTQEALFCFRTTAALRDDDF